MNRKTKISGLRRALDVGNRIFSAPSLARCFRTGLFALVGAALVAASSAYANPKGGQVTAGSATISQTSPAPANSSQGASTPTTGSQLYIDQTSNRAVIDWQSFSIAPGEQTRFHQPAPSSVTLNRVVSPNDPSVIAGRLIANGQIVLINQNGITFSKGAEVNVNSLLATTTDISNANFMAGRMKFDKPSPNPRAAVVNQGLITVGEKGLAALVAPSAINSGVIQAKLGKVVLGGAQTYTVDFYGDGLISFDVGPKVTTVPTGPDGQPVKSLVSNTGRIDAPGGTVLLTADAAAGIIGTIVDARGQIAARTSGQTPGSVTIDAGPGGAANLSGKIDVSGLKPGRTGGSATVTGGSVALASTARIDARGDAGGGTVRIGGGRHGQDSVVRNAQTTSVSAGAVIDASATGIGNGGPVTVWSDQATRFAGSITATGGSKGGDGGFAEISSHNVLDLTGTANVGAARGLPGTILLDPRDLTIVVNGQNDSDVNPTTGVPVNNPNQNTDISVSASVLTALTGNLLIEASRDLTVAATLNFKQSTGTIDLLAGRNLTVNSNVQITTAGANLLLAAAVPNDGPPFTTNSEFNTFINFSPTGALTINGSLDSGTGTIFLIAGTINTLPTGGISINGSVKSTNSITNPNGNVGAQLVSTGSITEAPPAIINVPSVVALTLNDKGAPINLMSASNQVSAVTLSALNNSGTAAAAAPIAFANSGGFQIFHITSSGPFDPDLAALQFGINTAGNASLSAVSSVSPAPISTSAGTRISAANLTVRTQSDQGGDITLTNPDNAVPGNVTLSALNAAGNTPAAGVISFVDSGGFTVAGVDTAATATLQAGGTLQQGDPIIAQNLVVRTLLNGGGAITLTDAGNAVPGNVTLSALNTVGTAPAPGAISFVDSTGFTIAALPFNGLNGQEIGINTAATATLQAGGALQETGMIAAQNLVVRTLLDAGASITLTNPDNAVPGNVTLSALNNAGTAPAPGAISFVDSTGFTVAAQPQNGLNGQEVGVNAAGSVTLQSSGALRIFGGAIDAGSAAINISASSIQLNSNNISCGNGFTGCDINTTGSVTLLAIKGDATEDFGIVNAGSLTVNAPQGTVQFDGPITNGVDSLAGMAANAFQFVNCCSFTVAGVSTTAGDIRLRTTPLVPPGSPADITLTENVAAGAGKNNVALVASGNLTETGGNITASGLIANAGEAATLTGANAVTTLSGTAGTSFEFVNTGPLTLANVPKVVDVGPQAGLTAANGNVELATKSGDLSVFSEVNALGGGIRIGVGGDGMFKNSSSIFSNGVGPVGDIVILADRMSLTAPDSSASIVAGRTSAVVLGPFAPANGIALGVASSPGVLGLGNGDLDTIAAGLLQIGYFGEKGNINLASAITINADQVPNLALVTGGGVSQTTAATLTYPRGRLGVIAGNSVTLDQSNVVDTVAGVVNNSSQNFQFTDGGANLTVGSLTVQQVVVSIDPATNFPVPSRTGNPVAGVTATAANDNIVLQMTGGGNLMLTQPVNAGDIVGLSSAGTITQDPAPIIASSLAILSADRVSLGAFGGPSDPNQVGTLAAQVLNPGESFVFRNDAKTLTIGTVMLPPPLTLSVGPMSVGTLSGVVTNNANLGLRVTSSGDLLLKQNVASGSAGVGLEAAGQIQQTGGAVTGSTLEVSATGPVSLPDANMVAILAAHVTGAQNSFLFRDDRQTLTVGAVPILLETGSNAPPSSQMLSVAGLSGVTTNGGNIILETTTSGNLVLNQSVNANNNPPAASSTTLGSSPGLIALSSAGTITQDPTNGLIVGSRLEIQSVEAVSLGAANRLGANDVPQSATGNAAMAGVLSGDVTATGQSFLFRDDRAGLTVGTVDVVDSFVARQLNPQTLVALPAGGLSGVTTSNGNILLETTTAGNLALNQPVNAGTGIVGLSSAGTVTQASPIMASSLAILSQERVSLGAFVGLTDQAAPNVVATLAAQVLGPGQSFVYRNDARDLTIGTIDVVKAFGGEFLNPMTGMAWTTSLSGVTTNNANIGLRVTGSGNLALEANVNANGGGIGLEAAGQVQMTGPLSGTVEISSLGPVSLTASAPVVLSAQITGAGNSFQFVDNGAMLTIGSSDVLREQGTGTPPNNQMLSIGGLVGVSTNNGNILLQTVKSGDLVLNQSVNAGTGVVGLSSAGTVTQAPPIIASSVAIVSADRVSLGAFGGSSDPNQVDTLAAKVLHPGESFVFRNDAKNLTIGTVDVVKVFGGEFLDPTTALAWGTPLSGVATNNANIGLRVTSSGDLLLTQNVTAGTAGVGFEVAGQIQQTGGVVTGSTLEVSAAGPVSLPGANVVPVLAGQVTGSTNGFLFRDDRQDLTVGTVPALLEMESAAPVNIQMLSVAGISGVTTSNGNIALETTSLGNVVLNQSVKAGTASVTLNSAGTITEQPNATITAATLTGSSAGNASFAQPGNMVANLGAFATTTGGNNANFTLTDGQALNVTGSVNVGTGTVTLNSAGMITEPAGGLITAGTLSGRSVGGASLTQGNRVGTFGPFSNTTSGLLSFTDAQPLTTGMLSSAGGVTLSTAGAGSNLTLGGDLSAPSQTVTLSSAGTITQTAAITAQNLVARTQSDAGAALTLTNPANDVPGNVTLSALNSAGTAPAAGNIDFVDSTGFTVAAQPANGLNGQEIGVNTTADVTMQAGGDFLSTGGGSSTLTVGGLISSGAGVIALAAGTGGISISGSIASTGSTTSTSTGLGLFSTGPIIENATGTISQPYVLALTENNAGAPITLTGAGNRVGAVTLSALNSPNPVGPVAAPGKISFTDSNGFQILPATGIENFDRDLMVLKLTPAEVSALTSQAFGINTSGDAFLSAVSSTSAFITTNAGGRISAANLLVRNQSDLGQEINLTNPQNTVRGNVTLSTLNTAGNAPASGAIDFVDSTGFTVAAQPGNGLNGQEIGVNTTSDINLVTLNNGSNLVLSGNLSAPGHMLTLTSAGTIVEQPGVAITAGTLAGSSAGNASFAQPGNLVANLGAFTTTISGNNGDFALTNGQALNITGLLNAGTGAVTLNSAGTIAEPTGGLITARALTGSSAGGSSLTQANQVATFGPFNNTTSGLLSFTDAQPLATAGGINSAGGVTLTTSGTGASLTLGANLTASGQAVTLNSAGNITEMNDPVITASGLTVSAAGKVSLGIDGGTVFPANANMVGTLTGTAGGSFGFLNATALTVGAVSASAGDVLIQVNNAGQSLTLAGNINVTAAGRVILDTAGGFSQVGTATVNAPVLAIDTTGSGVNTLLGFITSPSVNASVVSNLPPAGKTSNPIQFGNLSAPNSVVLLFADQGSVSGPIQAGQLGLSGTGNLADLQGTINGVSGPTAALLGVRAPGPDPTYLFNDCIIAASNCVVIPLNQPLAFLVTQPQTASEIQALSVSPVLSAQFVLIEPEIVKGVRQSEDPDAPVINIFDEERLCDETAKSQPTKEPCREER